MFLLFISAVFIFSFIFFVKFGFYVKMLSASSSVSHTCEQCSDGRIFKSTRGLNIHITRCHKNTNNTFQTIPSSVPSQSQNYSASTLTFDQILNHLHTNTPIVKRIPRGARVSLAKSLTSKIHSITSTNPTANIKEWQDLFTFSYTHFHSNRSCNKSLTAQLKLNSTTNPSSIVYK